MKDYNAGPNETPYIQFVWSNLDEGPEGHWALSQTGGNGRDYPALVCSKTQGN